MIAPGLHGEAVLIEAVSIAILEKLKQVFADGAGQLREHAPKIVFGVNGVLVLVSMVNAIPVKLNPSYVVIVS